MRFLSYLFWPNLGTSSYGTPKALALLILSLVLIALSLGLRFWRMKQGNAVTRKLSKSWPTAALSFGIIGVVLVVARVEGVQFVTMRFWWVLWAAGIAFYLFVQIKKWRSRHYEVLPSAVTEDPRQKYLPRKKRK